MLLKTTIDIEGTTIDIEGTTNKKFTMTKVT